MPKPSSNLFRCEPERLALKDSDETLLSPRTQLLQGGLVQGYPTILVVLSSGMSNETSTRIWAHELRAALDVLEPAKEKPKRVRTRRREASPAAQEILDRVVTDKETHRG